MCETGVVRSNECYRRARPRGIIGISFRFSLMFKYVVLFSLESPHPGDSNEYTQYTIFEYKKRKKNTLIIPNLQLLDFVKRDSRRSSKLPG